MNKQYLIAILIAGLIFSACSSSKESTSSTSVWINKEEMQNKSFHKVFIVVMTADIQVRVKLEKDLAAAITARGLQAVKSIDVMPGSIDDPKKPDKDTIISKVKSTGCDAAFVAALLKKDEAMHYTPGSTTFTWMGEVTGYYDFMYSTVTRPGYYTDEKSYIMQSNLYDAASKQIMWSVISPVFNPSNLDKFSQLYMSELAKQLEKEKVLKK